VLRRRHRLFVVSSPSGGGKTTLVRRALQRTPELAYSVSSTTRPPRSGEVDGVDYYFLDREGFEAKRARGDFIEHAEVHGHLYGTDRRIVESLLAAGKDVLLDVDVKGAAQIRAARPDAVLIFVMPPSIAVLEARLRRRCTDCEEEIARRLRNARGEVRRMAEYDYLVINDELERATENLLAIITAERSRIAHLAPGELERFLEG
jgi:guanylate kinase